MRIAIDFNVTRNEIVLVCENADSSRAESCINFIAPGMDTVTVNTEKDGEVTQTALPVTNGSACHVLDDAMMRTAGKFTIYAEGKQRLCFVVPENIPDGAEYTISMTDEGFRVRYVAPTGGGDHDCIVKSVNGKTGHVVIEIPESDGTAEHECAVSSVNGQTGDVVINIPEHECAVKSVNGQTGDVVIPIPEGNGLPEITEADNGKLLVAVNGVWTVGSLRYDEVENALGTSIYIG